jgi:hypothetical protein
MADFPTTPALLDWTSVLATTNLSSVTPVSTAAVPIGAGQYPFEAQALAVDFLVSVFENSAIGNLTITFQCSPDGSTWFTLPEHTYVGTPSTTNATGIASKFTIPTASRQWRFVRAQFQAQTAQTGGSESTVTVRAGLVGVQKAWTKVQG